MSEIHGPEIPPSAEEIVRGLAFIDTLDGTKRRAFLGLFAGAKRELTSIDGKCPMFGKAECEWVPDWRDFYGRELGEAGLVTLFQKSAPQPCLGMAPGHFFEKIVIMPSDLGFEVREAWWNRHYEAVDQLRQEKDGGADQ